MKRNPFDALGLPTDPALTDEQVRAAWRAIAAATHPDRPDGGDLPRYTQASAAYAELRAPWGRSEAYADLLEQLPLPPVTPGTPEPATARPTLTIRPLRLLPARIIARPPAPPAHPRHHRRRPVPGRPVADPRPARRPRPRHRPDHRGSW